MRLRRRCTTPAHVACATGGIVVIVALRADPIVGLHNQGLAIPPCTSLVACKVAVAANLLLPCGGGYATYSLDHETYGPKSADPARRPDVARTLCSSTTTVECTDPAHPIARPPLMCERALAVALSALVLPLRVDLARQETLCMPWRPLQATPRTRALTERRGTDFHRMWLGKQNNHEACCRRMWVGYTQPDVWPTRHHVGTTSVLSRNLAAVCANPRLVPHLFVQLLVVLVRLVFTAVLHRMIPGPWRRLGPGRLLLLWCCR